ncbi:hypothetical protein ASD99_02450 [Mesorhizobium sp. Root695]|uniref:PepSY domain-containing protein n=1 Tax=Mesorhizobium sp. Root695 TaxID=1736589 RepID=UPI00070D1242|nr:PepSY domain-containing protein [Mesorhizobium sp. Root695]KRB34484.1 hypothetical protein ASD99_02450 [Mesorhizobium sp. Root695]
MTHGLTMLTLLASLGGVGAAMADEGCSVPMTDWQPPESVQRMAEKQGWTVRRIKIDDGCYEIRGLDASGRPVEAIVDPATLKVVSLEYQDDDRGGSGPSAPNGAVPKNGVAVPGPVATPTED